MLSWDPAAKIRVVGFFEETRTEPFNNIYRWPAVVVGHVTVRWANNIEVVSGQRSKSISRRRFYKACPYSCARADDEVSSQKNTVAASEIALFYF